MKKNLLIALALVVVSGCVPSFFDDNEFQNRVEEIKKQNEILRLENEKRRMHYAYLDSTEYKDKYAKMYLQRVSEGENELVLTYDDESKKITEIEDEELFEKNSENIEKIGEDIQKSMVALGYEIAEAVFYPHIREYHIKTKQGVTLFFNAMSDMHAQAEKLKQVLESATLDAKEYIDARVSGKVYYK